MENGKALSRNISQSLEIKKPLSRLTLEKGLRIIEEHFPHLPMTKQKVEIWSEMLGNLTNDEFIRGVKTFCLAHREIFPNTNVIANIRHYALTDPNRKTAQEAWGEVVREISRVGSYGQPIFSTPDIKRAVDCIGWKDICLSETIGVERAHFMRAYDGIVNRDTFNVVAGMERHDDQI